MPYHRCRSARTTCRAFCSSASSGSARGGRSCSRPSGSCGRSGPRPSSGLSAQSGGPPAGEGSTSSAGAPGGPGGGGGRPGDPSPGATAFARPPGYEPFGIVFLEAMAYGLACIASDRCAMPEIVEEGVTGYVVGAFATEALAARLLELAEPERARAFGEAGRRRFLERYTWDAVAARIVAAVA